MGYNSLIQGNISKAFNLVKDLAENVVLVKKSSTFDFNSGAVKSSTDLNVSTKAIILDSVQSSKEHNTVKQTAMLMVRDIGDIKAFDTMIIGSNSWRLGAVIKSDGFITTVEVFKEN